VTPHKYKNGTVLRCLIEFSPIREGYDEDDYRTSIGDTITIQISDEYPTSYDFKGFQEEGYVKEFVEDPNNFVIDYVEIVEI